MREWFPLRRALSIALDVADALHAIERSGRVHLGVNPDAIVLPPSGGAHLCDAGASVRRSGRGTDAWSGFHPYAAQYLAPEQLAGERALDIRADIYAFGTVLFHMLSGEPPFQATSPHALARRRREGRLPGVGLWREDPPAHLDALLARCLAYDREQRHASVAALMDDLLGVAGSLRRQA